MSVMLGSTPGGIPTLGDLPVGQGILVPMAGKDGRGLYITGAVDEYSDLPTSLGLADGGTTYLNNADGLLYAWTGTSFPAEGQGAPFKGDRGIQGFSVVEVRREGSTLVFGNSGGVDLPAVPMVEFDDLITYRNDAETFSAIASSAVLVALDAADQAVDASAAVSDDATAAAASAASAADSSDSAEYWAGQAEATVADGIADGSVTKVKLSSLLQASIDKADSASQPDHTHSFASLTDKPTTYPPTVGTTAATAKAGDYKPPAEDITNSTAVGRAVIKAADADAARTAIGASSLVIGTTSTTAAAGNDPRLSDTRTPTDNTVSVAKLTAAAKADTLNFRQAAGARLVGLNDDPDGFEFTYPVVVESVKYKMGTADASGTTTVELRKNGVAVSGTSATAAVSPTAVTGSWSFAAGDVLTVYTTAVGTTPGQRLTAILSMRRA